MNKTNTVLALEEITLAERETQGWKMVSIEGEEAQVGACKEGTM